MRSVPRRQQVGLGVVQVGRTDDEVGRGRDRVAVGRRVVHARHRAVLDDDPVDRGPGHDPRALGRCHPLDRVDHRADAALRVQDAVGEVEVAHQVVHARRGIRARAEEHGGVPQHLLQAPVLHGGLDEGRQRPGEQAEQPPGATEHVGCREPPQVLEARVEEPAHGHRVGLGRRVEVALEPTARSRLDRLEERDVGLAGRGEVDGLVVALAVHAVPGVESDEVELLGRGRPEQPEEVVEHLGHEVPARPGVEPEATGRPGPGAPPSSDRCSSTVTA